jgi:ribosomal-protein-alanine N-acetyltransferase
MRLPVGLCRLTASTNLQRATAEPQKYRICEIEQGAARDCARIHGASFDTAWDAADFATYLGLEATLAHAAIETGGGPLCGIVMSRRAADEAEILTLAVDRFHRRRGLGRSLLATHAERLGRDGASCLFLEVDEQNSAATALYLGLGFAVVGERKDYYRAARARPSRALVMRLDLAETAGPRRRGDLCGDPPALGG